MDSVVCLGHQGLPTYDNVKTLMGREINHTHSILCRRSRGKILTQFLNHLIEIRAQDPPSNIMKSFRFTNFNSEPRLYKRVRDVLRSLKKDAFRTTSKLAVSSIKII